MTAENQTIENESEINEPSIQLAKLLMRASREPELRSALLADPRGTLQAEGFTVAESIEFNVVENTPERIHLVLPMRPTNLTDEELSGVAGGLWDAATFHEYQRRQALKKK